MGPGRLQRLVGWRAAAGARALLTQRSRPPICPAPFGIIWTLGSLANFHPEAAYPSAPGAPSVVASEVSNLGASAEAFGGPRS